MLFKYGINSWMPKDKGAYTSMSIIAATETSINEALDSICGPIKKESSTLVLLPIDKSTKEKNY